MPRSLKLHAHRLLLTAFIVVGSSSGVCAQWESPWKADSTRHSTISAYFGVPYAARVQVDHLLKRNARYSVSLASFIALGETPLYEERPEGPTDYLLTTATLGVVVNARLERTWSWLYGHFGLALSTPTALRVTRNDAAFVLTSDGKHFGPPPLANLDGRQKYILQIVVGGGATYSLSSSISLDLDELVFLPIAPGASSLFPGHDITIDQVTISVGAGLAF